MNCLVFILNKLNFWCSLLSEGKTAINIIDPAFEGNVRAKVAEVFPFMKPEDVSKHYKMIEQVLEDEKMVSNLYMQHIILRFLWYSGRPFVVLISSYVCIFCAI